MTTTWPPSGRNNPRDGIQIRTASVEDAEELLELYSHYVRRTAISFEWEVPSLEEFQGRVRRTLVQYPYLTARQGGKLLGYAYASQYQSRAAYQWGAEGSIYLEQGIRGSGLGTPLYRCLMELLRCQGVRTFYGCITHPNPASEAFHQKLGFTQAGLFPKAGYKLGQWWDILWMELPLGERSAPPEPFRPFPSLERETVKKVLEQAKKALN